MRANVQFEFDTKELEQFGVNVMLRLLKATAGTATLPQIQGFYQGLATVLQQFGTRPGLVGARQGPIGPMAGGFGPPRGSNGPMGGPDGYGPLAPPPFGMPMYGAPPAGQADVHPIGGSSPLIERCFLIEATRMNEAGWCCHQCGTYNALGRATCRHCNHANCERLTAAPASPPPPAAPIVTPAPAAPPHSPVEPPS